MCTQANRPFCATGALHAQWGQTNQSESIFLSVIHKCLNWCKPKMKRRYFAPVVSLKSDFKSWNDNRQQSFNIYWLSTVTAARPGLLLPRAGIVRPLIVQGVNHFLSSQNRNWQLLSCTFDQSSWFSPFGFCSPRSCFGEWMDVWADDPQGAAVSGHWKKTVSERERPLPESDFMDADTDYSLNHQLWPCQAGLNKVLGCFWTPIWQWGHDTPLCPDVEQSGHLVHVCKWWSPCGHLKHRAANAPYVRLPAVSRVVDDLRGGRPSSCTRVRSANSKRTCSVCTSGAIQ